MKIFIATSNDGKFAEYEHILKDVCEVSQLKADLDERRSDDPEEIARDKAKRMSEKFGKTVVCDDSGLFIKSLNDFPGVCSAYIHYRIGLSGILKLMEGVNDRSCEYRCAVAICSPGEEAVSFLGKEKGSISTEERGEFGFGHDPIFVPWGFSKTYAEMENLKDIKKFRKMAILQLVDWLRRSS